MALTLFSQEISILGEKYYYPFEFVDEENNSNGIFHDIWSLWSEKTGEEITFVNLESFSEILSHAQETENAVIGLIFHSEKREEFLDFSIPFYQMKTYVYFNQNLFGIKTLNDISGLDIGVVKDDYAFEFINNSDIQTNLKTYASVKELIRGAIDKEISVFIADGPIADYYLEKERKSAEFRHMENPLFENEVYAAVKKGNTQLVKLLNEGISQISEQEIEAIVGKWTGTAVKTIIPWNYIVLGVSLFLLLMILGIIWNMELQKRIKKVTERISSQNIELRDKNKELEKNKQELERVNEALKNSLIEKANLASGFESILKLTSKISKSAKENPEKFLDSLLKIVKSLIPSADYGSISLFEGDKWKFISAIGHDIQSLKKIDLNVSDHIVFDDPIIIDEIIHQDKSHIMSNQKAYQMEKATKPIGSSMIAALKVGDKKLGSMALDIALGSYKKFQEDDVKLMNAFSNVASAFLAMQQYMIGKGKFQKELIISMIQILELHDPYTKGHSENVANISAALAEKMDYSKERIQQVYWAGLVHDIGKILIPSSLLSKPEKLMEEEFQELKKHPEYGAKVLESSQELKDIVTIVKHHHERWDGNGYPDKIAGTRIPEEARILSIADTFDAITSDRPYRGRLSWEYAINEIKQNAGKQFDPSIAAVFLDYINREWKYNDQVGNGA